MNIILSIEKTVDKAKRICNYDGTKCLILTDDSIILYDIFDKTPKVYNINKHYDDICYCSRLNCYYAIVFNDNIIYKLDPDFQIIFSITVNDLNIPLKNIYYNCSSESTVITDSSGVIEILSNKLIKNNSDKRIISCIIINNTSYYLIRDNNEYYILFNNITYKLPSAYNYISILHSEYSIESNECTLFLSAENQASNILLSINTNELYHNSYNLLFEIAEEEKNLAQSLYDKSLKASDHINNLSDIEELITINNDLQNVIDDIIIEEYVLYRKTYQIIKGT